VRRHRGYVNDSRAVALTVPVVPVATRVSQRHVATRIAVQLTVVHRAAQRHRGCTAEPPLPALHALQEGVKPRRLLPPEPQL
jgi:hypothetical protein